MCAFEGVGGTDGTLLMDLFVICAPPRASYIHLSEIRQEDEKMSNKSNPRFIIDLVFTLN